MARVRGRDRPLLYQPACAQREGRGLLLGLRPGAPALLHLGFRRHCACLASILGRRLPGGLPVRSRIDALRRSGAHDAGEADALEVLAHQPIAHHAWLWHEPATVVEDLQRRRALPRVVVPLALVPRGDRPRGLGAEFRVQGQAQLRLAPHEKRPMGGRLVDGVVSALPRVHTGGRLGAHPGHGELVAARSAVRREDGRHVGQFRSIVVFRADLRGTSAGLAEARGCRQDVREIYGS
mmetsp:Transcript_69852/g.202688  ORF Transcript_69852/g.202688 Transcript_69852/m.202688 type:complete len:237 (-) Transcript_69852:247-957(-)